MMLIVCGASCKKDNPPPTLFEQISADRWFFETSTADIYDNCERRSYYLFMPSGEASVAFYEINMFGACVPVRYREGNWELVSDRFIHFFEDGSANPIEYEIIEVSEGQLVLRDNANSSGPVTYSFDKTDG